MALIMVARTSYQEFYKRYPKETDFAIRILAASSGVAGAAIMAPFLVPSSTPLAGAVFGISYFSSFSSKAQTFFRTKTCKMLNCLPNNKTVQIAKYAISSLIGMAARSVSAMLITNLVGFPLTLMQEAMLTGAVFYGVLALTIVSYMIKFVANI